MTPAAQRLLRYREPPNGILQFVDEELHVELDPWQEKALLAFGCADTRLRLSLQACAGPGKTAVLSWCGWWFLSVQGDKGEHPQGHAVSITKDNLDDHLWPEFSKWQGRSEYLTAAFTWTHERIFAVDHPQTWFLSARSWPKTASADEQGKTLSGLHSKFVLVLVDESGAIPVTVLRAGEQALSTCIVGRILQAGNTLSLEGMLYAAASLFRHLWTVIRITGDPDDPEAWVHSPRVGPEPANWARQQIAAHGRENAWTRAYILGLFPTASINALLGIEDVELAMSRQPPLEAYEWAQKRLGVDVARFGDDRTVIFPRQGIIAFVPEVMRHVRDSTVSTDIADRVMARKASWGSELEFFDATGGWAAGAVDVLRNAKQNPINVQFGAKAHDARYKNRRAEIWWHMAEWIKGQGAIPRLPELSSELIAPTYTFHGGQLMLEEKDQIKKRIGRSPDLADALALTFGMVDMPGHMRQAQAVAHQTRHEFDPFRQPDEQPVRAEWDPHR